MNNDKNIENVCKAFAILRNEGYEISQLNKSEMNDGYPNIKDMVEGERIYFVICTDRNDEGFCWFVIHSYGCENDICKSLRKVGMVGHVHLDDCGYSEILVIV